MSKRMTKYFHYYSEYDQLKQAQSRKQQSQVKAGLTMKTKFIIREKERMEEARFLGWRGGTENLVAYAYGGAKFLP